MKFKSIFIVAIALLISSSAFAQRKGGYFGSIAYSTSVNIGNASDYISNVSWGGLMLDGKKFITDRSAIGLLFGWNVFNTNFTGLQQVNNGAIYGNQARYLNYFPIMASYSYFMNKSPNAKTKPYFVAYAGAYSITQQLNIGVNEIDNDNWHFGLAPEFGVYFQVAQTTNITVAARYNYAFSSGTSLTGDSNNSYNWFNLNLGLGYNNW